MSPAAASFTDRQKVALAYAAGAALLACVAALALAGSASATRSAAARPAPKLADPTATATTLVNRHWNLLVRKDIPGLRAFLAPGFQVQRADGSFDNKATYLAHLATIESFTLSKLYATQAHGALVVRYIAVGTGIVNGKPYTPGPAPRLSVFAWSGTRWQLAAHANFNPLTG